MASPDRSIRPRLGSTASPCQSPSLPDDLLKEIFLRISSPVDLARASGACVTFRRLIADPSFIRRYRSLHPPLLLGFLDIDGFQPIEAPHPSAALARSIARAADFSFDDYLPRGRKGYRWIRRDVREGRVLLESGAGYEVIPDLAACDPLSRRYLQPPPPPPPPPPPDPTIYSPPSRLKRKMPKNFTPCLYLPKAKRMTQCLE
ncbi:unnamed protein product [Urochloa humidicola]